MNSCSGISVNQSQIQVFSQFDGACSRLCDKVLGGENFSLNFCLGVVLDVSMHYKQGRIFSRGCDQPDPLVGTKVTCLAVST